MEWFDRVRDQALRLGFDLVGIAPARPPQVHLQAYREWLRRGYQAGMAWMARPDRVARREEPALILPGVRSVVCVAVNYYPGPPPPLPDDGPRGRVSTYAWGEDYHDWMLPRLEELADFIRAQVGGEVRYRAYVDTGPVLERAFAAGAGLGFIGKNTCLIHPHFGSWLFLGEVLLEIDPPEGDRPSVRGGCGTCTRCLEACPTGALTAPYRLDARRCISYLTIEHKGPIPLELRPLLGTWIYGCDVCQEVCPWQRFARPTKVAAFRAVSPERARPSLPDLLALGEEGFRKRFRGTPILRIGRGRLLRNVAVALGNVGDARARSALESALDDPDPLVRQHAAWALARIGKAT
ncbi:MAG TPA: tRNA epoxyqueuosine(34) reductase QueG [Chloroflexi bacterium]|nr:tRNA epoxyqueuosine(34) reductase QueG [Chloroflexota bacterium]